MFFLFWISRWGSKKAKIFSVRSDILDFRRYAFNPTFLFHRQLEIKLDNCCCDSRNNKTVTAAILYLRDATIFSKEGRGCNTESNE